MREKLNTLPLSELKELAKAQGLKGFSSLRKAELIDLLCQSAEKEEQPIQPGKEQTVEQTAPPLSESIAVQQIDEMRNTGQKTIVPKTDKQRMDTQQMEPQQPEIRKDTGKDNFRSERNERSDRNERSTERNDGNRTNRNRADGKGNRTITRFDNRGGYQSRGRNQDNGRGQDNIRNQDNSRNQDTASSQDYMRNQENALDIGKVMN